MYENHKTRADDARADVLLSFQVDHLPTTL